MANLLTEALIIALVVATLHHWVPRGLVAHEEGQRLTLRSSQGSRVADIAAFGGWLFLAGGVAAIAGGPWVLGALLGIGIVGAVLVLRGFWAPVVVFDPVHDRITQGPTLVARVSEVVAVVSTPTSDPRLVLVLYKDRSQYHWTFPRMTEEQAERIAPVVADYLGVSLVLPQEPDYELD
jgi:hypothetical protein